MAILGSANNILGQAAGAVGGLLGSSIGGLVGGIVDPISDVLESQGFYTKRMQGREYQERLRQAMEEAQRAEAQRRIQQVVLGDIQERPEAYQGPGSAAKLMKYGFDTKQLAALGLGSGGEAPANVREWDHYSQLSPDQQRQYLEMKRASQMMNLGNQFAVRDPVSNQAAVIPGSQIQLGPDQTPQYKYAASAAATQGQQAVKAATEPGIQRDVAQAKSDVAQSANRDTLARSNQIAMQMYEEAMKGLMSGLTQADTGPVVGLLPAVTSSQQIAEGAVAAMAPVLKLIFRVAGEGTFTDKDQELLMKMLPTRKDNPDAIRAKMENLDAIIRMKLGGGIPSSQALGNPGATPAKRLRYNPQTGQFE